LDEAITVCLSVAASHLNPFVYDTETEKSWPLWTVSATVIIFLDAAESTDLCFRRGRFFSVYQQLTLITTNNPYVPTALKARTSFFVRNGESFFLAVPHKDKQPAEIRVLKNTKSLQREPEFQRNNLEI